jgi:hypothetical protein
MGLTSVRTICGELQADKDRALSFLDVKASCQSQPPYTVWSCVSGLIDGMLLQSLRRQVRVPIDWETVSIWARLKMEDVLA